MAIFFIVKQPYGSADDVNVLANKTKEKYFNSNLGYLIVLFFISIFFYHITDSSALFL